MNTPTPSKAPSTADQRWKSSNNTKEQERLLTYEDLYDYLYRKNEITALNPDETVLQESGKQGTAKFWCDVCQSESIGVCETHGTEHSKAQSTIGTSEEKKQSSAIASFPDEVQLCRSSIPGSKYGVVTKCHIPKGTWLGPYEGTKVRPEGVTLGTDATYMWEVYHRGKLSFYLDGSDEDSSSWMRFISCARNSTEQNLYAFQYCGNIYYRAFKEIPPGTELLVWYDEIYPQFMGIPLEYKDLGDMATDEINSNIPSGAIDNSLPRFSPCSSAESSFSNMQPNPPSTLTDQDMVTPDNDDAITTLSRDEEEIPSPLKRLRKASLDLIFDADTVPKRMKTINPFEEETIKNKVPQGKDFSGGNFSVVEVTTEDQKDEDPGLGVFRCGQCDKVFAQKSALQMHVCTRTPNKPFQCGFCGIAFANPNELRVHASAHCNEKPFKCGYCFRSFSGATTLNNHIRTHTGEKPFICEKCGKTFSQGSQLSKHLRLSNCYKHGENMTSKIM